MAKFKQKFILKQSAKTLDSEICCLIFLKTCLDFDQQKAKNNFGVTIFFKKKTHFPTRTLFYSYTIQCFCFGLEGFWGQPQGPNFPSPWATKLALRLDCSALTTPQKGLSLWRLVELKMLDFIDLMSTGISNLTSAADSILLIPTISDTFQFRNFYILRLFNSETFLVLSLFDSDSLKSSNSILFLNFFQNITKIEFWHFPILKNSNLVEERMLKTFLFLAVRILRNMSSWR